MTLYYEIGVQIKFTSLHWLSQIDVSIHYEKELITKVKHTLGFSFRGAETF